MSSDGGEVAIRFTSQQQEKLWGDIARTVSALSGLQGKGEEMAATTGKASASLRRFAEAVKAAQSTPDSRLADEMAKLKAALDATLLTQEEFAAGSAAANERYRAEVSKSAVAAQELAKAQRSEEVNAHLRRQLEAMREVRRELAASRDAAEASAEEERRDLARVDAEWDRYAASVKEAMRTPVEHYHAKLEKLAEGHLRGKLTIQEYHAAAKKAFTGYRQEVDAAAKSQEDLAASARVSFEDIKVAGMAGLASVALLLRQMRTDADQAGRSFADAGKSAGALGQIGDLSQQKADIVLGKQFFATGATRTVGEAYDAVRELRNVGVEDKAMTFAELQRTGLISGVGQVTGKIKQLEDNLGKEEVGGMLPALAKALEAQKPTKVSAEELIGAAAQAGVGARMAGVKQDELFAAAGIAVNSFGAATGGERLKALTSKLAELGDEAPGSTLSAKVAAIDARKMNPGELKTFFGSGEALQMFDVLRRQRDFLDARTTAIGAANEGTIREKIIQQKQIPDVYEPAESQRRLNAKALAQEDRARAALDAEGVQAAMVAGIERGQFPGIFATMRNVVTAPFSPLAFRAPGAHFSTPLGPSLREAEATAADLAMTGIRHVPLIGGDRAIVADFGAMVREMKDATGAFKQVVQELRKSPPVDRIGPARREAAVAAGGN